MREKLIDEARKGWTNRLIDLSRRNNLLYYKPVSSGTLELPITPRMMELLSDGETVPIRELLNVDEVKIASIRAISRKGLENLEEKGLPDRQSLGSYIHDSPVTKKGQGRIRTSPSSLRSLSQSAFL